jgi:hypothetical protein
MKKLQIKAKKDSPEITLDPQGFFKLKGVCHPENVTKFFEPVMDWLDEYKLFLAKSDEVKTIKIIIFFKYFNSATYKYMITLLQKINEFTAFNVAVSVEWHYEIDDEEMKEAGEDLFEFSGIKIPYVCIESPFI